jgi:hypothetical protein
VRTVEELREASGHLNYEVGMLMSLANGIASGIAGHGTTISNALIESFVVHLRCVLDFLYAPKNRRDDDVIAEDYFDDPAVWDNLRPPISAKLGNARDRAGKEMAHLTYARLDVTPEAKLWPFVELTNEISEILNIFFQNVDRSKLGDEWLRRSSR